MTISVPARDPKIANDVKEAIDSESASLREISLQMHNNPELGYEEVFAHKILTDYIEERGFTVTRHAYDLKTAFVAEYVSPAAKAVIADGHEDKVRTIGFISEMDSLPNIGHACGHNLIAIVGLASALGTKVALEKNNLIGRIKLFGTPAEETTGGKIDMINKGAFDGLDACVMSHPAPADVVYCTILSVGGMTVEYFGKSSHASASPWEGVNALDAMVHAYNGLALVRQQTAPTSRIHCIITNGGAAANIIPDYSSGKIMYRATSADDHSKVHDAVLKVVNAAAEATGCTVKITKEMEYQPVPINEHLASRYASYTADLGIKYLPRAVQESLPSGSTDMGNVAHVVPGIHPVYNIVGLNGEIDSSISNHSYKFTDQAKTEVAHKASLRSAKGLALTGLDVLIEEDFAAAIKESFEKQIPKEGLGISSLEQKFKAMAGIGAGCGCH
ncbi:hypothetical protein BGZ95_005400 [Linnemannia exigua]|uniref:Peptidase M20 domain-containing protein 2 n=1 Tax=Linnemannia exigua TaxID=604196 RepID=A0AAD4H1K5_9FUNG|nr:hypothetical protein BGZ95_005400 [Linnemannia exigua]